MRVEEFDFTLPEELIALRPAHPRDAARLLVVRADGGRECRSLRDLPELLREGDCVVVNDSKVMAARLHGARARGGGASAKIEVLLLKQIAPDIYRALCRPAKRLKEGDRISFGALSAEIVVRGERGEIELKFDQAGEKLNGLIAQIGEMPLPPYIAGKRKADARDAADYQTVYARETGSVAAPTAGLHFTPELLAGLEAKGIERVNLTLHVGAGTFLPVTAEDINDHLMQPEWAELSQGAAETLNRTRARGGRIVAVGSTALRTLESAADDSGRFHAFSGETALFIMPSYRFKSAEILLTNFHLPRSTLFMLVAAFAGLKAMRAAYAEAIAERFRFYSYGDACLLFRPT